MNYTIWLTGFCNLKCTYCYEGTDKPNFHMTKKIAHSTLEFIRRDTINLENKNELVINFHGGEPLLNFEIMKYFIKEVKKFKNIKPFFTMTTNGTILNDEILNLIAQENIELTVSIDGDSETHDKFRTFSNNTGSHAIVIDNLKKLMQFIPDIRIRMTVTSNTVDLLSDNIKFLLEKGFLTIVPGIDTFSKDWTYDHLKLLKREIVKTKLLLTEYPNACVSLAESLDFCGTLCTGGKKSKHILYDGDIYPCMVSGGDKQFSIGHVDKGVDFYKLNQLLKYSYTSNLECDGCDLQSYCNGSRCKIINKIKTNHYNIPPAIECQLTNLLYELNGVTSA